MLTGRRAFDGDDVTDTLAAVLQDRARWSALPTATPPPIRRLLERCLRKDRTPIARHRRAQLEIDDALTSRRGRPRRDPLSAPQHPRASGG